MTGRRRILRGYVFLGMLAMISIGAKPRPLEAKAAEERLKAQQALVEKIADSMIARIDKEAELKQKLAEHEKAMLTAPTNLEQSRKVLEVQEIALKEYLEGTYPTDRATAQGTIALAKSDLQKAMDRLKYNERLSKIGEPVDNPSAELARQKATYSVEQAERQLDVLNKYEKPRQTTLLTANIEAAKKVVRRFEDLVEQGPKVLDSLKTQVQEESLSEPENRALRLLEDVITLQDKGDLDAAQAKLDEAAELWRAEENRRAAIRFKTTRQRIRDAVKRLDSPATKPE